jgi:aspartate aminotransferase
LNYPNNPTGYTYGADKLRALAEIARRYRVVMLSDEIYGEVHHEGKHRSIAEFYPEGTIISTGLSKWCGAGGWRLGTFTFPENLKWLLESMAVVASETFTATSAPIQFAAVRAFRGGPEIEEYLKQSRRVLKGLGRYCAERLRTAKVVVGNPDGAFYLFPDFRAFRPQMKAHGISTSAQLCERLLDDVGVATLAGSSFGRKPGELTLRLSYVDFDGAEALAAASRDPSELDGRFVKQFCPKLHDAVERVANWASSF